jgi:hypothetical protein
MSDGVEGLNKTVFLGTQKCVINAIYFVMQIAQIQHPGCINSSG